MARAVPWCSRSVWLALSNWCSLRHWLANRAGSYRTVYPKKSAPPPLLTSVRPSLSGLPAALFERIWFSDLAGGEPERRQSFANGGEADALAWLAVWSRRRFDKAGLTQPLLLTAGRGHAVGLDAPAC